MHRGRCIRHVAQISGSLRAQSGGKAVGPNGRTGSLNWALLAAALALSSCSDGGGGSGAAPPTATPPPAPTPSPTPSPSSTPSPAPTSSPSSPPPTGYDGFTAIYAVRYGSGVTFPASCSSFRFDTDPPAVTPVQPFGSALNFRWILTPQVWGISGEISGLGFDGRTVDPSDTTSEVAHVTTVDGATVRFKVIRPAPGGAALDYARLATLATPVNNVSREYTCVLGVETRAADVSAVAPGAFPRRLLSGTAYVREGGSTRTYALEASAISLAVTADRQVTITFDLTGTAPGGASNVSFGTFSATAPIDAARGTFAAPLTSATRSVTGSISGRLFGPPDKPELGLVIGATVTGSGTTPAYGGR